MAMKGKHCNDTLNASGSQTAVTLALNIVVNNVYFHQTTINAVIRDPRLTI